MQAIFLFFSYFLKMADQSTQRRQVQEQHLLALRALIYWILGIAEIDVAAAMRREVPGGAHLAIGVLCQRPQLRQLG